MFLLFFFLFPTFPWLYHCGLFSRMLHKRLRNARFMPFSFVCRMPVHIALFIYFTRTCRQSRIAFSCSIRLRTRQMYVLASRRELDVVPNQLGTRPEGSFGGSTSIWCSTVSLSNHISKSLFISGRFLDSCYASYVVRLANFLDCVWLFGFGLGDDRIRWD